MIHQHPVLDAARQRQAAAIAGLFLLAYARILGLLQGLRNQLSAGRGDAAAMHRASLEPECEEPEAG